MLTTAQGYRAERLWFVHLAVAHEGPDLAGLGIRQSAGIKILEEARLVDRHQRPEAHRHGRKLPEIRHQPWMRIRRDAAPADFLPEVVELLLAQATKQKRTRIDAGRRMPLHEHEIARMLVRHPVPE